MLIIKTTVKIITATIATTTKTATITAATTATIVIKLSESQTRTAGSPTTSNFFRSIIIILR